MNLSASSSDEEETKSSTPPARYHDQFEMMSMRSSAAAPILNDRFYTHLKHALTPLQAASGSISSSSSNADTELIPAKRKRRRRLTGKQRERYLKNQADDSQLLNLTLDINNLRQQVHDLSVGKQVQATRLHVTRQHLQQRILEVISEFFRIFRNGYNEHWSEEERDFISNHVDEHVVLTSGISGINHFLEQWRRYTELFHTQSVQVTSTKFLTKDANGCIVECVGQFKGQITRAAIETVFPHILTNIPLVESLLGAELLYPTRTLLYFDVDARIVHYNAHVDFFAALSALLGENARDIVTVMSGARIGVGDMIPAGPGEEPQPASARTDPSPSLSPSSASSPGSTGKRHLIDFLLSHDNEE